MACHHRGEPHLRVNMVCNRPSESLPVPPDALSARPPFDPAAALYRGGIPRPAHIEPVALPALTPLQRALLVIDGTVTTFLEAWVLEPVAVQRLWQRPAVLARPDPVLDAGAGSEVLERGVMLVGARSGAFFAFAESLICVARLPAVMRHEMESTGAGLGAILMTSACDTRREGLWYGRERPASLPPAVAACTEGDFLVRSYRVMREGQVLMQITERFPWRPMPVAVAE